MAESQDPAAISALLNTADFMASLPPEERLILARNGALRGVVSLSSLTSFQPAADPVSKTAPLPAQITQRILSATHLAARALEGRLAIPDLKMIMATQPDLMDVTDVPVLTEAALWAGESDLASSIVNLSPAAIDPRLALVLALYNPGAGPQVVEQRLAAAGTNPAARRAAVRDAVIAWSAGLPVGSDVSQLLQYGLPSAPAGNVGLRAALDFGANRGSKGEVILLTAFAMQASDPASVDAETLIAAVKALRRTGLPFAARDLARDYLLATFVTFPTRVTPRPRAAATTRGPQPPARRAQAPIAKATPASQPTSRPVTRAAPLTQPLVPSARVKPSWGTP